MNNPNMVDLCELTDELWRQTIEKHLREMMAQSWIDGRFCAGWESAIEEMATRLGVVMEAEHEH